ncbi:hypothetical protein FB446DRAFT_726698 [Lentinula raphanica]|nr:hypothetical protein FB446DRAFT_726698 [Lentinula raphanica]
MSTISTFSLSSSVPASTNSPNLDSSSYSSPAPSHNSAASSIAGPSTWRPPSHWNLDTNAHPVISAPAVKKSSKKEDRAPEDDEAIAETRARFTSRLATDHAAVLNPDVETPFVDTLDVVNRLLPYHVFSQPQEDLPPLHHDRKGKTRASEIEEIAETEFALATHRRRRRLEERFRKARVKSGGETHYNPQTVVLAQSVLDADRAEVAALNAELRAARSEYDRLERQKKASSNPPLSTSISRPSLTTAPTQSAVANGQSAYYRPYPFSFTTSLGTSTPVQATAPTPALTVASSTASSTPQQSVSSSAATPPTYPISSAIPVQLPVTYMPALQRLGIAPVIAGSVSAGQPQPPAILRGSSSNGTILNLEINVGMLQPSQMSGLAVILNSLMSRSSSNNTSSTLVTPSNGVPAPDEKVS